MEHEIGDIFEHNSEKGKVLLEVTLNKEENCDCCFFRKFPNCSEMKCASCERIDKTTVKFIEIKNKFQPFDIVIYKPTGEVGLVKSCNGDNTFVLFRIQSTAHCCKTSDLELE